MPCPHNEITIVQRSQRQSAVAAAAYQSGEKLFCEYDQQVKEDIALTGRMQQLCMLAGIPVIDHVILGNDQSYFSFREKKILPMEQIQYSVDLNDINLKVAEKEAENYGYEKPHKKSIKESLEENRKKITSGQKTSGVKKKRETTIE